MQNPGEKYVGKESEGGRGGGGDVRAAGATAAAQAEPGRKPVMQRGGATTWVIPTKGPCSHHVPHKGPHSSRTRMGKSTTSPTPLQLRKRPQNEKEYPRGSSDISLHKVGRSSPDQQHQYHLGAFSQCRLSAPPQSSEANPAIS